MYSYSIERDWTIPINYSYSEYHGYDFFESYFKNRNKALNIIKKLVENGENIEKESSFFEERELDSTGRGISEILKEIQMGRSRYEELLFFVRKFEITKLLYSSYDNETQKGKGIYDNLRNYILLSFCCLESNILNRNLRFFNASLKLNDLLIAKLKQITNEADFVTFAGVLRLEMRLVRRLMTDLL